MANQLCGDAQLLAALANAALEHVRHSELARNRAHVFIPALELKRRGARDDLQICAMHEAVYQLLGQAVREVLLLLVAADIHEREHRNRVRRRIVDGSGGGVGKGGGWLSVRSRSLYHDGVPG